MSDVFGPGMTGTVEPIGVCAQALSTITPAKAIEAYDFIVRHPFTNRMGGMRSPSDNAGQKERRRGDRRRKPLAFLRDQPPVYRSKLAMQL